MTLSPEGCGTIQHPPQCLCDVHIPEYIPPNYLAIPYELPNGEALAYFGKWDGTLNHWFELCDIAWPQIKEFRRQIYIREHHPDEPSVNRGRFSRGLPEPVYAFLVQGIKDGMQPTPLRTAIIERFDVTINKSYVTKLRHRLRERGEI